MAIVIGDLRAVLGLDSTAFQNGLQQARSSLRGLGRDMQSIGRTMTAAVSIPLAGVGGVALKAAGEFEASMNRVKAATGAGEAEMKALENAALTMGETTQFKASEAASAIEILAKNGLDASQILGGALEGSMLLAASSGSDLAGAGDLATDVMLQFGKRAEDLTGLVDGMTGVMLASKFGFDDYRLAIAQAGGVAGGVGVSFEDFNAVIAGTSGLFASGSDAGTAYKTFLQRLVPASDAAATAMNDLGLEFFNADGSMKSMAAVAQELQEGLAGLSDEARNDALSTIFGTDALRTAIGLADQGAAGIDRLKATIADTSAEEQAAARMAGFNGEMRKLASAVEALMIAIANSGIIEWATQLAQKATELILRLKETNPELLRLGVAVGAASAALGPIVLGLGLFVTAIGAISAPVALAVAAIAGIAAGVIAFRTEIAAGVQAVRDFAVGMAAEFTALREQSGGWAQAIVQAIVQGLAALYEIGVNAIRELARGMRESVTGLIEDAASWGRDISAGVANGIKSRAASVRDGVIGLANNVKDAFTGEMEIQSPSKVFTRFGAWLTEGLANGISSGTGGVDSAMSGMSGGITSYFSGIARGASSLSDVFDNIKASFGRMLDDISSRLMQSGMQTLFGSLFGSFDPLSAALGAAGAPIGIPGFASGGMHSGGYRIVGENGPELEATGAARYFSAGQTQRMLSRDGGGSRDVNVTVSIDRNGNLQAFVDQRASGAVQQGLSSYNKVLPGRVQQINANPRKR